MTSPSLAEKLLPSLDLSSKDFSTTLTEADSQFQKVVKNTSGLGNMILGVAFLVAVFFLAWAIFKLSASAGNEQERTKSIRQILYAGLSISLLGGLTTIISFFLGFIM